MKNSKFLKNSKDMIHRSFNPAKCKTSLRLAGSRLKLMRNKKQVQVNQMKREIAQLLESGQDRTARIRVEHVIREEKMMAAYDLLEIYCELIIARLPIIESQKSCPIDLKEAITSIVFASPRCGDVPELLDARKQITAKYGKEFTTAAIELRPDCGVSRMLVEKLSATATDGQTKLKILGAIAEEHNVKWDPTSLEEKDSIPPSDLLSGPSTFVQESKSHVEHPRYEAPVVQNPQTNNFEHGSPKLSQQDHGNSPRASAQTSDFSTTFQPQARPSGGERANLYQGDGSTAPLDRQRWNMEFKDAASAAHAAAESAEMASMAARAAAELSNREKITQQYSSESHKSDGYISNEEGHGMRANSKFVSEQFSKVSTNRSSSSLDTKLKNEQIDGIKNHDLTTGGHSGAKKYTQSSLRKSKASFSGDSLDYNVPVGEGYSRKNSLKEAARGEMRMERDSFKYKSEIQNEQIDGIKNNELRTVGHSGSTKFSQSSSLKSKASIDGESLDHNVQVGEGYSRKNSLKEAWRGEMPVERDSFKFKPEIENGWQDQSENVREERIRKDPSFDSPRFHSSISDDVNIFSTSEDRKFDYESGENPFVGGGVEDIHGEAAPGSPRESAALVFGTYDSDTEVHGFDTGPKYDEPEPYFHRTFSSQKSPKHHSTYTDSWSPISSSRKTIKVTSPSPFLTRKNSSPDLAEKLTPQDDSEKDNSNPVIFDDSDGPSSEIDEEMDDAREVLNKHNKSGQSFKSQFKDTSDGSPPKEEGSSIFHRKQLPLSSDDEKPEGMQREKDQAEKPDIGNVSGNDSGEGLNFNKLTGGLRHKGYNRPPFVKKESDASFKKGSVRITTSLTSSAAPAADSGSPRMSTTNKITTRMPDHQSEPDSDSEEEEYLQKRSGHKKEVYTRKEFNIKPNLRASNSVFGSDSSDLDEEPLKEPPPSRKNHLQSGISRRTKASTPSSGSYHKTRLRSEFRDSDTPKKGEALGNSGKLEISEQPTSPKLASKPAKSNYWGPPEPYKSATETSEFKVRQSTEAYYSESKVTRQQSSGKSSGGLGNSGNLTSESNYWRPPDPYKSATAASASKIRQKSEVHKSESKVTRQQFSGKNSGGLRTSENPTSVKLASNATNLREEEPLRPQPKTEEPSRHQPKTEEPSVSSSEKPQAATLNETSSNKEDKRASHVHPKLPDYDSLLQFFKK